jgi:hypothetical protein
MNVLDDESLALLFDYSVFGDPNNIPTIIPTLNYKDPKDKCNDTSSKIRDWKNLARLWNINRLFF